MTDNNSRESTDDRTGKTDGGAVTQTGQAHREVNYLDSEVNILNPTTPFMRDHLRIIWTGFAAWVLVVFGPVTLTAVAPDAMSTQIPALGFPLHYFLIAIGAPTGGLILSYWYVRKRDQLDRKYGIDHAAAESAPEGGAVADGGE